MNIPRSVFARLEERLRRLGSVSGEIKLPKPLYVPVPDDLAELPHTVLRCAVCGVKVGSWGAGAGDIKATTRCPTHGPLHETTLGEIREEWTRRGKPEKLNMRLSPIQ